jgi:tRNA pseudouridine55 synthase
MIISYQKISGETMTECMDRMRHETGISPDEKITYAGRLDPAASGVVIFLSGEDRFNKDDFLSHNKTYIVQVLFGITTDTDDLLGIITEYRKAQESIDAGILQKALEQHIGITTQPFPAFSARRVSGKPLWQHARERAAGENRVANADTPAPADNYAIAPTHITEIYSIGQLSKKTISGSSLKQKVHELCGLLRAHDFRQNEIETSWNSIPDESNYSVITLRVFCSSGSYMRTLAHEIGLSCGTIALAMNIQRESIGEYIFK